MTRLDLSKQTQKQRETNQKLKDASKYGDEEKLLESLREGANIETRSRLSAHKFATPLILASYSGHPKCVSTLIAFGANMEAKERVQNKYLIKGCFLKQKAIHAACQNEQPQCVAALLEAGCDIESKREDGATPLFVAAENGSLDCLSLLISKGAKIDVPLNQNTNGFYVGVKPIYMAARFGNTECVAMLLAAGADIEHGPDTGYTPLIVAADNGHAECVSFLLKSGAELEATHNDNGTALYCACQGDHPETVEVLIKAGANIESRDGGGTTPLFACRKAACISLLLDAGADIEARDFTGNTSLMQAADSHFPRDSIIHLLASGADIEARNRNGRTALWISCRHGNITSAELLIAAGADLRARDDNSGLTPLHAACIPKHQYRRNGANHAGCVSALLAAGADIEATDSDGHTPLIVACKSKKTLCVRHLVSAGADINARDYGGDSAMKQIIHMRRELVRLEPSMQKMRQQKRDFPDVDLLEFGIDQRLMCGTFRKALSSVSEQFSECLIDEMAEFAFPVQFLKAFATSETQHSLNVLEKYRFGRVDLILTD